MCSRSSGCGSSLSPSSSGKYQYLNHWWTNSVSTSTLTSTWCLDLQIQVHGFWCKFLSWNSLLLELNVGSMTQSGQVQVLLLLLVPQSHPQVEVMSLHSSFWVRSPESRLWDPVFWPRESQQSHLIGKLPKPLETHGLNLQPLLGLSALLGNHSL